MTRKTRMSLKRRLLLMMVGYMALGLDKLEGKPTAPPPPVRKGRIKIVS